MRSMTRQSQAVLQVAVDDEERSRVIEIPAWMIDPVICASMVTSKRPGVTCEALRALRDLLDYVGPASSASVVKDQHSQS